MLKVSPAWVYFASSDLPVYFQAGRGGTSCFAYLTWEVSYVGTFFRSKDSWRALSVRCAKVSDIPWPMMDRQSYPSMMESSVRLVCRSDHGMRKTLFPCGKMKSTISPEWEKRACASPAPPASQAKLSGWENSWKKCIRLLDCMSILYNIVYLSISICTKTILYNVTLLW